MENSKLLERLRYFSAEEIRDFIKFAESPYFNTSAVVVRLLKYLAKYHPELSGPKVRKSLVFKKIYPAKDAYKEKRLNDLATKLFQLSEEFLIFDSFKKQPLARARQEMLAYREHDMVKDYRKAVAKTEALLDSPIQDEDYHAAMYRLHKDVLLHPHTERIREAPRRLRAMLHHLESMIAWSQINAGILTANREKSVDEKYEIKLLSIVKEECSEMIEGSPGLRFLEKFHRVIQTHDFVLAKELSEKFDEVQPCLSIETNKIVLHGLINIFCIKARNGTQETEVHINNLYKSGERTGLILDNEKVSNVTFFNVCTAAAKQRDMIWQNDFFEKYKNLIYPESKQRDTINTTKASLLFLKINKNRQKCSSKDIQNAVALISNFEYQDTIYLYQAKGVMLRLLLLGYLKNKTLKELDYLHSFCHSFEMQLRRDTVWNERRITAHLNLITKIRRISDYICDKKRKNIENFITELQSSPTFTGNWLANVAQEELKLLE